LIRVVDLRDPKNPSLAFPIELPIEEGGVSALSSGGDLYVTVKRPLQKQGSPSPYASYFLRRVDLSDPSFPVLGAPISVPGKLLAVRGTEIFTRDKIWGEQFIETAVARLELHDGLAYLQSYQRFPGRSVGRMIVDDGGSVTLTSNPIWLRYHSDGYWSYPYDTIYDYDSGDYCYDADYYSHHDIYPEDQYDHFNVQPPWSARLTILAPAGDGGFDVHFDAPLAWAGTPFAAVASRTFFDTPDGVLMLNVEEPDKPRVQAYFQTLLGYGRRRDLIDQNEVLVPAGRYGIHQLDACKSNLLPGE
jgi:hypothetical protein